MREQKEDRTAQIIREATRLFSHDGYKKVTIKQLAASCNISEPALYRHFSSKESIYTAVLDSLKDRLSSERVLNSLEAEDDIKPLLTGLAEHILTFYRKNEDIYRLLLFAALEGHDRANHVYNLIRGRYIDFLKGRLDSLYEKRRIRKKNNEITARCFVGMVFDCALGFSLWKGMQGKLYDPREVISNNIPIYTDGLILQM